MWNTHKTITLFAKQHCESIHPIIYPPPPGERKRVLLVWTIMQTNYKQQPRSEVIVLLADICVCVTITKLYCLDKSYLIIVLLIVALFHHGGDEKRTSASCFWVTWQQIDNVFLNLCLLSGITMKNTQLCKTR